MKRNIKTSGLIPKFALRTLLLLLAIMTATFTFAHDFEVDGIYYSFQYGSTNQVYVASNNYEGNSYSGDVIIPEKVTYDDNEYIVTEIGYCAFSGCNELYSVSIPNSVKTINSQAFESCTALTSITIPNSVTRIEQAAFMNCTGLNNLNLSAYITSIEAQAFEGCSSLTNVIIPNSVTRIGGLAFDGCSELQSISMGNSVTTIDEGAFANCIKLSEFVFPKSVSYIGFGVFSGCNSLTSIIVDQENSTYDSRYNCNAVIETNTNRLIVGCKTTIIPENVNSIGDAAFYDCSDLEDIVIPNSIETIGKYVFTNCANLTNIIIPNSVVFIDEGAFQNCSGLVDLQLSNSLVSIEMNAFQSCSSLRNITLPSSIKKIGHYSLSGCYSLISVEIPNGVDSIMDGAFRDCSSLKRITIPETVKFIGYDCFSYCRKLQKIIVHENNPIYDSRNNCNAIIESETNTLVAGCSSTIIPNSVISIGESSFLGVSSSESINIPSSVTTIGKWAFNGCLFKRLTIPASVETIGEQALACYRFEDLTCFASTPPTFTGIFYHDYVVKNAVVHVPASLLDTYQTAPYWKNFKNIVGDAIEVDSIVLDLNSIKINIDEEINIGVDILPSDSYPNTITWFSTDDQIASVLDGVITAHSIGECDIIALCQNKYDICHIIVGNNQISLTDTATLHGNTIVIPVSLENESELTAFQTDLYLPEGFELVKEDGDYLVELSDRKGRDHVIMANDLDDGGIRIISYSTTVKPYSGNEGELFYITVKTPDDGVGDYTIMLKNTLLTTTDHEELNAPDASCTVTVYPYIMGDANNSGTVTVTDIVVTARYILNYHPDPFVFGAADVNYDGNISVTDIVIIAQMIMDGAPVSYPRRAPARDGNLVRMSGQVINDDGLHRTVSINLDNAADYTAFQLDLQLPAGMTADNFTLTGGSGFHTLEVNVLDNGKTRLLCYTPSLNALNGDQETLLTFDVTADAGAYRDIVVDGIEMVTAECQTTTLDAFTIKMDNLTSVDELALGDTVAKVEYFNLSGQQIDKPSNGVTIVVTTFSNGTRSISKVVR